MRFISFLALFFVYLAIVSIIIWAILRYDVPAPPPPALAQSDERDEEDNIEVDEIEDLPTMMEEIMMNAMPSPVNSPINSPMNAPVMRPPENGNGLLPAEPLPTIPGKEKQKYALIDAATGTIQSQEHPISFIPGKLPQIGFGSITCWVIESFRWYGKGPLMYRFLSNDRQWVWSAIRVGPQKGIVHLTPNEGLHMNQFWEVIQRGIPTLVGLRLLNSHLYITRRGEELELRLPKPRNEHAQQLWVTPYAC